MAEKHEYIENFEGKQCNMPCITRSQVTAQRNVDSSVDIQVR